MGVCQFVSTGDGRRGLPAWCCQRGGDTAGGGGGTPPGLWPPPLPFPPFPSPAEGGSLQQLWTLPRVFSEASQHPSFPAQSRGGSLCPCDLAVTVCLCFVCRLVSGNSIEEKLLKNGTKDLIREVAAQGNDYSMAFLTQVPACALLGPRGHRGHTGASWFLEGDSCALCSADHPGAV